MYVLVEDGIVKSVQLDKNLVPLAIECDDDIRYGDLYDGVTFTKLPREIIEEPIYKQPLTQSQMEDILMYLLGV